MKATIRTAYFDGEKVYQVVANPDTIDASIEYTSGDIECARRYCEKYFKDEWREE